MNYQPKLEEPWVNLHNNSDLKTWNRKDEICWNQVHRQNEKYKFYISAFDYINENNITGDYYEFGCHKARTIRMALTEARHQNLNEMRFFAFDSFKGLPPNESSSMGEKWASGQLVTTQKTFKDLIQRHGLYANQVHLYPGFYDKSLNADLITALKKMDSLSSFICVDCDFYESAVPVFKFIENFLQEGTIIYIDDLFVGYKGNPTKGVGRAFLEHQSSSSWKFIPHMNVGYFGRSYIVCTSDESSTSISL